MKRSNSSGSNSSLARPELRHPRLDLRLALDFYLAHLRAQADDAVGKLEQVALERAQLALDAGTRDRDLAGFVYETVDEIGSNAQHRALRRLRVGGRREAALRAVLRAGLQAVLRAALRAVLQPAPRAVPPPALQESA